MKYQLFYHPTHANSRAVMLMLEQLQLPCELYNCEYWQSRNELAELSPFAQLPILIVDAAAGNITTLDEINAIESHLSANFPEDPVINATTTGAIANKRWLNFVSYEFNHYVTSNIINERVLKFYQAQGSPNANVLRQSRKNLEYYLNQFTRQFNLHQWLTSNHLTLADFVLAGHISLLDYFDEINWQKYVTLGEWYMVIKSRPGFKKLLNQSIYGFKAPDHYNELDFVEA